MAILSPKSRQEKNCLVILGAIVLISVVIGIIVFGAFRYYFANIPKSKETSASITINGITTTSNGEHIGISDGSYAFDTGREDGSLKVQAAQAFAKGNVSEARKLWQQAVALSTNDAEVLIYLENSRVQLTGRHYVTLVVGTMLPLAGTDNAAMLGVGRDNLQGAYVAQKEFNDGNKIRGGVLVRLLIASTGSKEQYATQVAHQVVARAQSDHTIVGVMGWPYSSRAIDAIKVLDGAHIPMLSETASSDQLTNISRYFFRVSPANEAEAQAGAYYAQNGLHVKHAAIFYDPKDSYSQSLALDFKNQFENENANNRVVDEEKYTVGKPDTLNESLQNAMHANPDFIYFSGYSSDISTLLVDLPPGNLPVLGGDALYELGGYSSSAHANFNRLHFTAFAYPDQWEILGVGNQKPNFFNEYPADFNPQGKIQPSPYGYTRADNDTILSYDATVALLRGCDIAFGGGKETITADDLKNALASINGANAFQGVSGQIAFGPDGNPIKKAILMLYVKGGGAINMSGIDPTTCFLLSACR